MNRLAKILFLGPSMIRENANLGLKIQKYCLEKDKKFAWKAIDFLNYKFKQDKKTRDKFLDEFYDYVLTEISCGNVFQSSSKKNWEEDLTDTQKDFVNYLQSSGDGFKNKNNSEFLNFIVTIYKIYFD